MTTRIKTGIFLLTAICVSWIAPADEDTDYAFYVGTDIFSTDDYQEYLGYIIEDIFHEDSIINVFGGFFGSVDDYASIHNRDGDYGSLTGEFSAYNPNATSPPIIYWWNGEEWELQAYLTKNHNLPEYTVDPDGLLDYLWSRILDYPTSVTASDGAYSDRIHVEWNPVADAVLYQVYRSTNSDGSDLEEVNGWREETSFSDKTAVSGVDYFYWVRAATDDKGTRGSDFSFSDAGWRRVALPPAIPAIRLGDLNGDGRADLALRHADSGLANLGLMSASATSWTVSYASVWGDKYEFLGTGDLNGDGRDDLILKYTPSQTVYLCQMNPDASGWDVIYYSPGWYKKYTLLGVGDLNGDGMDDLILKYLPSQTVYICIMNPPGSGKIWTVAYYSKGWARGYSLLATGDLNGDGRDDLVLRRNKSGTIYYCHMSPGGGTWTVAGWETWGDFLSLLALADLNGDGRQDAIVRDNVSGEVLYYLTEPNGIPAQTEVYGEQWGTQFTLLATGDLNGDGRDDTIVGDDQGVVEFDLTGPGGASWAVSYTGDWTEWTLMGGRPETNW